MANNTGQKFGGRQKGTPNASTKEIKEAINQLITNNIDKLQEDLDSLDPLQRLQMIERLLKFVLPQPTALQEVEVIREVTGYRFADGTIMEA